MKKNKFVALVLVMVICLELFVGCNQSVGMGSLSFKRVHVDTHNYSGCFTVEKWHNDSTGIEIETEELGSIFLSEGTYFLLESDDYCPFCSVNESGADNG